MFSRGLMRNGPSFEFFPFEFTKICIQKPVLNPHSIFSIFTDGKAGRKCVKCVYYKKASIIRFVQNLSFSKYADFYRSFFKVYCNYTLHTIEEEMC